LEQIDVFINTISNGPFLHWQLLEWGFIVFT